MLFSAGLGTRLKPFTDTAPKALYPVNGVSLLQRNINYLKHYGITRIVINLHHYSEMIQSFLAKNNNFGVEIILSKEENELLETGGGLVKAKPYLQEDAFLAMNSDILTDLNLDALKRYHLQEKPLVSLAVSERESTRKLIFNKKMQLCAWQDVRNASQIGQIPKNSKAYGFSGIQIINQEFFEKNNYSGKFSIIKSYLDLMKNEKILGFVHTAKLIDVGKPQSIKIAEKLFP